MTDDRELRRLKRRERFLLWMLRVIARVRQRWPTQPL
jgi:hypothetical protein